jgi:negative regulator of sigma E activity
LTQNIGLAVILTVLASVTLAVASVIQHLAVGDTAAPQPAGSSPVVNCGPAGA